MPSLTVSVVVGADRTLIGECLQSLLAAAPGVALRVVVVCNRPDAPLAAELAARFPAIEVITRPVPWGFARNHNAVAATATTDYLLLANDDLVFLRDAVSACLQRLSQPDFDDVAALSPRLLNTDGTLQRSTYGFPKVHRALLDLSGLRAWIPHAAWTERLARWAGLGQGRSRFWAHDRTCDVETFRGAAMFVRRAAWQAVGPLSEATRVGGEMAEWHRRCQRQGWRVVFCPDAEVIHHGSRTVGRDRLLQAEYLKGYLVYFQRHGRWWQRGLLRTVGSGVALLRLAGAVLTADAVGVRLWRANLALLAGTTAGRGSGKGGP